MCWKHVQYKHSHTEYKQPSNDHNSESWDELIVFMTTGAGLRHKSTVIQLRVSTEAMPKEVLKCGIKFFAVQMIYCLT